MTGTASESEHSAGAGLVWTAFSLVCFMAAAFGIFPLGIVLRQFVETTHAIDMALWSMAWSVLAAGGVVLAARAAYRSWPSIGSVAVAIAGLGAVLSVGVHFALQDWATQRYGYYDPDLIGWSAGMFALLVGLSTAAFGVFIAPRHAATWPLAFVLLGSAGVVLVVVANLPGLADGLAPGSWPLAGWLGASGLFAVLVTAASLMRARHPRDTPWREHAIP